MPDPMQFQRPSIVVDPSTGATIDGLLSCITAQLGLRTSYLTTMLPTRDRVTVTAATHPADSSIHVGRSYALRDSWCGLVCQPSPPQALIISDIRREPRYAAHPATTAFPDIRCYIGVPLIAPNGDVAGTLCAGDSEPRPLTPQHASLLSVLAQTITALRSRDAAAAALQATHDRFQSLMAAVPGMIFQFVIDRDGQSALPYASDGCADLYGITPADAQADPQRIIGLLHPDDRARWVDSVRISAERMEPWIWEGRMVLASGEVRWHQGTSRPERQSDGSILWNGMLMDVTDRKRAEERLWEAEARFQAVVQSAPDAIILADQAGTIIAMNRSTEPMFGYTAPEVDGQSMGLLMPELPPVVAADQASAGSGAILEVRGLRKDGSAFPAEVSLANWQTRTSRYFSGIIRDISARKAVEAELRSQAQQLTALSLVDALTGLANRRGFITLAEQALKVSQRMGMRCALLFLDMDGLKQINDTLGHEAGDQALIALAHSLRATFREADVIGRLGGDEFVVFLATVDDRDLDGLVARLHDRLAATHDPVRSTALSVSIGVAIADPAAPHTLEDLLNQADQRMYAHKRGKPRDRQPVGGATEG